jgi:hypothetical protein
MSEYDDLDQDVDDIINQIKSKSNKLQTISKDRPELNKEDIEKFIIDNASEVVADCVDMIQSVKLDVQAGGDSRLISSAAELVGAFTSAIDTLSKLKLSDDKLKTQKELKEMDIKIKLENTSNNSGIYLNREEVIKHLLNYKEEKRESPPTIDI